MLTQSREDLIRSSFASLDGARAAIVHLYNAVSPAWRDIVFRMSKPEVIEIARTGISILMVEQNARQALNIADKGYVMVQGRNAYTDTGEALLADPEVRKSFLGG